MSEKYANLPNKSKYRNIAGVLLRKVSDKSLLLLSQQDSNTVSDDDDDQDDEVVEFDSDSSDAGGVDGHETESTDDEEGNAHLFRDSDITSAPKEVLLLVGGRSRFGRSIRINHNIIG